MTIVPRRHGGTLIDTSNPLDFQFNGRRFVGYAGDTLASALLGCGIRLVARSLKYHRPRGILTAGVEEPNALVQLETGSSTTPNTRATTLPLYEGLRASSQNSWPSCRLDLLAILGVVAPVLRAGFFYKTFMRPRWLWPAYEWLIRRAAGMGRAPHGNDPSRYSKRSSWCDVLVVGGGAAGLVAALTASRNGAKVVLADERHYWGGSLALEHFEIDGTPAHSWIRATISELRGNPNVQLLSRTTVFGAFDDRLFGAVEMIADRGGNAPVDQRLWRLRAKEVIFATGAIEQPLMFPSTDRPGVMLAGAARAYLSLYGVKLGERVVVATNNDSAYSCAMDLKRMTSAEVVLLDTRQAVSDKCRRLAEKAAVTLHTGAIITGTSGRSAIKSIDFAAAGGPSHRIDCDLLATSGGWSPTIHLHAQAGGRPIYDESELCYRPGASCKNDRSIGAAAGVYAWRQVFSSAHAAATEVTGSVSEGITESPILSGGEEESNSLNATRNTYPRGRAADRAFVDLQSDVTIGDMRLSGREGYDSSEHLKRYTTLGMGTDQGKTSNVIGLSILADMRNVDIVSVAATTFRPPYSPVTFGALAGIEGRSRFKPVRRSPVHAEHVRLNAVFAEVGAWQRPRAYPRRDECVTEAAVREAASVRERVGMVDVTTLGKIDVQGPDAAEFLDRIYITSCSSLAERRCRYAVMLREDGIVFDDGTVTRLGTSHFMLTTTTANAAKVLIHLEFHAQVVWPHLKVLIESVTDQWACIAIAGPDSRSLLQEALPDASLADCHLPHLGFLQTPHAGSLLRILRVSFSGERAYEVYIPWRMASSFWRLMLAAGEAFKVAPYGTEALTILRTEKGHVAGPELDGRATVSDLRLERLMKSRGDYVGKVLATRSGLVDPTRPTLVGLVPLNGKTLLPSGAQLVSRSARKGARMSEGHITTTVYSPSLRHPIALGMLARGRERVGEIMRAEDPLRRGSVQIRVCEPVFFDPDGARLRG